jgi:hypothetical protein
VSLEAILPLLALAKGVSVEVATLRTAKNYSPVAWRKSPTRSLAPEHA